MKHLIKFTLMALLGSIIMISCQKDKGHQPQPQKDAEEQITLKQMANPDNPYDKQGEMHNAFLNYMATNVDFSKTKKMNADLMINVIKKFYSTKKMDFGPEQQKGYETVFNDYAKIGMGNGQSIESTESMLCKYFPILCSIQIGSCLPTFLLDSDKGGTATERTLNFIDAVKEMETEMLTNKEVTDGQKRAFLIHTAVARFSVGYWHNVVEIEKAKSPYYKPIQGLPGNNAIGDVATADAIGAAIGGILFPQLSGYISACFSMATAMQNVLDWYTRPR